MKYSEDDYIPPNNAVLFLVQVNVEVLMSTIVGTIFITLSDLFGVYSFYNTNTHDVLSPLFLFSLLITSHCDVNRMNYLFESNSEY